MTQSPTLLEDSLADNGELGSKRSQRMVMLQARAASLPGNSRTKSLLAQRKW